MEAPPDTFSPVGQNSLIQGSFNVIGKIVDFDTVAQSRGSDLLVTFSIRDVEYGEPLKIRLFGKTKQDLPDIRHNGDIILLRKLTVSHELRTLQPFTPVFSFLALRLTRR